MRPELIDLDTAILTNRTVVRRFREQEGADLYNLFQANMNLLIDDFPKTRRDLSSPENAELYVRQSISDWMMHRDFTFGIWAKDSAQLIGFIRLFNIDWDVPRGELVYFLDNQMSGKGYMTEALREVVRFAINRMGFAKLYIRTGVENFGSQRIARKMGFRREGDLRADFRTLAGDLADTIIFGLTQRDSGY